MLKKAGARCILDCLGLVVSWEAYRLVLKILVLLVLAGRLCKLPSQILIYTVPTDYLNLSLCLCAH